MKQSLLTIVLLLTGFVSFSQYNVQSKYFVYLQTEPAQPFYIRIDGQTISANSSGYLILPQLKTGDYKLTVGFPGAKYPEQVFDFVIDTKDKGYLIKDYGTDGWGLFDLQTMAIQKATGAANAVAATTPAEKKATPAEPAENVSDFTKILSKAANDPSILEKPKPAPVPVVEKPKPQPVEQKQEVAVTKPVQEAQPVKNETATAVATSGRIVQTTAEGTEMIYTDKDENGRTEEINVFIPSSQQQTTKIVEEKVAPQQQAQAEPAQNKEEKFVVDEKKPIKEEPAVVQAITPTGNCKHVADEDDFLKLRRAMAQKENDEGMIAEAAKNFKSKCYTTAQVKYLSSMFLSNAGKYNFYAAAYPHVADKENFASLESEIKNQGYKDKFNSLLQ